MPALSNSIENKVYKFAHLENVFIITNIKDISYKGKDKKGNVWLEIFPDGKIQVYCNEKGYAWDGCSPKWEKIDFIFGGPDGRLDRTTLYPITYYASLIHDAMYQFKGDLPISRKASDLIFRQILQETGFMWTGIYYFLVRRFGGMYGKWYKTEFEGDVKLLKHSWPY